MTTLVTIYFDLVTILKSFTIIDVGKVPDIIYFFIDIN
jgi:hypothetical protein